MALYTLADTHLSLSVDKPMDVFGARWSDYTNKIYTAWQQTVEENDTVVIPGDISWGINFEEAREDFLFLEKLPGTKIISKGNHDYWWATIAKINDFFEKEGIKTIKPLFNNAYKVDDKMICGTRGWFVDDKNAPNDTDYEKIVNREVGRLELSFKCADEIDKDAEKIVFLHFPPVFGDYICDEIVDCMVSHGVRRCYYGHIHGKYGIEQTVNYKNIDFTLISADYLDFKPFAII